MLLWIGGYAESKDIRFKTGNYYKVKDKSAYSASFLKAENDSQAKKESSRKLSNSLNVIRKTEMTYFSAKIKDVLKSLYTVEDESDTIKEEFLG